MHEKDLIHLQGLSDNIESFLNHAATLNYQLSINPELKNTILDADDDWENRSRLYQETYSTETGLSDRSGYPLLSNTQHQYDFVELFFIQDNRGNQTARSYGNLGKRGDRWWFRKMAVNQDYRSFLSHSYYSLTGGKPVASFFHPILEGGSFIGIMGMDINFHKLQELVESYMVLDDMYAIVTDMEGVVIAHPDNRFIDELYNLKKMTHYVIEDKSAGLNAEGYHDMVETAISWPDEVKEAVLRGIAGEDGYYENVRFSEGAQNIYFAPVSLSGSVNMDDNYVVLLIHDRTPIIRTRNTIFLYIALFILTIILVLYFLFHGRFNKQILHPLEILIDSMKSLDFDHFEEIKLVRDDEFSLLSGTYNRLRKKLVDANKELKDNLKILRESEEGYKSFADVGLALSSERDVPKLLELILDEARNLTRADGGTLYKYDPEKNCLTFEILHNETMKSRLGGTSENPVTLPAVPMEMNGKPNTSNVSSCAAVTGKIINISNVYETEEYDFSGVQTYDRINQYHSQSMLVIPMKNMSGELVGVIQLINARNQDLTKVQPFSEFTEKLIIYLASQAAAALTNVELNRNLEALNRNLKDLFDDFIHSIAAAMDEKSAFTGHHIERVVNLTMLIADAVNRNEKGPYRDRHFNKDEMEELRLAAWMHDIGKVTTPESLMDKRTKLEGMQDRIEIIESRYKMICTIGDSSVKQCDPEALKEELDFLKICNQSNEYLSDEKLERLNEISRKTYSFKGESHPYLTEDELYNLSIRKGNLNREERRKIEHHAEMSRKILDELSFPPHLSNVGYYGAMHHEKLDGSGYPQGLTADDIPLQARIITVADIFEALTAKDRPYRQPIKLSRALTIMDNMVKDGHIDGDVLKLLTDTGALSRYARDQLKPEQVDIDLPAPADKVDF